MALLLFSMAAVSASAEPASAAGAQRVPYRAGSAAGTFGPATAAGDFDADGKPDFAVADRVPTAGDVDYVVEVRLSGGPAQVFRFGSAQRALEVTAVDVDHDHDLDLVFTPVVGRRIVSVWLNDGAGHFKRDDSRAGPQDLQRIHGVTAPRAPLAALAMAPTSRRLVVGATERTPVGLAAPVDSVERLQYASLRSADAHALDAPRGPPSLPSIQ